MRTIIAHSDELESNEAVADLIEQAERRLEGARPVAGLLYMGVCYDHALVLEELQRRWPDLPLIGSTTDGELSSVAGFQYESIVLTLFVGEDIWAETAVARDLSGGVDEAVEAALGMLSTPGDLCIALPHPVSSDTTEVIRQLDSKLDPNRCTVVGALSGDRRKHYEFAEFHRDEVLEDACPLLVLGGGIRSSVGVGSGWFPVGEDHIVTESDGNVVHQIDGRPALELLSDRWGIAEIGTLGEHPLAVRDPDVEGGFVLRAVLTHDPRTGSLVFGGGIPEGARVCFTEVFPEGILEGSRRSIEGALERYPGSHPSAALVFSCVARKWMLGTRVPEEAQTIQSALGNAGSQQLELSGFYGFGEIAPNEIGRPSHLHNETCISIVLGH